MTTLYTCKNFISLHHQKFAGSVRQLVVAANGSAQRLLGLLAQNFSSYCDVAHYRGRQGMMAPSLHHGSTPP